MDLSLSTQALLCGAAALAGFVDSMAGGGGLITVPVLLAAGLPPHLALGTNKLQASFGSVTATLNYRRGGLARGPHLRFGVLLTAIGAALGTAAVQALSTNLLQRALPWLLALVFVYVLLRPQIGAEARPARLSPRPFYLLAGLTIGFYDGFLGPGTGSFWTLALVLGLGLDLRQATGHTKVFNATSNLLSLAVFALGGHVLLGLGLLMGLAQCGGAFLGSHLVLQRGTRFVRLVFLTVVALTLLKLLSRP